MRLGNRARELPTKGNGGTAESGGDEKRPPTEVGGLCERLGGRVGYFMTTTASRSTRRLVELAFLVPSTRTSMVCWLLDAKLAV